MKKLFLYQVYDNVGQCAITTLIPANNDLTALLGFRDSYILNKNKQQNPYFYQALDLFKFAELQQDDDGVLHLVQEIGINTTEEPLLVCHGSDVMKMISEELAEYGIDDKCLDDNFDKEAKK